MKIGFRNHSDQRTKGQKQVPKPVESHMKLAHMAYNAAMSQCGPAIAANFSGRSFIHRHIAVPQTAVHPAFPVQIVMRPNGLRCLRSEAALFGGSVLQDVGATSVVIAGAYGLVSAFDILTRRKIIEQSLSRKLVHILSGLLFLSSWPIYRWARYFASIAPLLNCLRLVINGLSLTNDQRLIASVTRKGKPEELLKGPLYYVCILIICAIAFWRDSPVAMISLAMMCGGDGIADIMGRRFGYVKIPYNPQKSWAGSISMFLFGFLVSIGMLYYFWILGYIELDWLQTVERVALVSFVATVVESLPITQTVDDNLSVPLASMVTSLFVFGYWRIV